MSADERLQAQAWLAEGLARRVEAAARRTGADPHDAAAAAQAARQVCEALAAGHVCLGLEELEPGAGTPPGLKGLKDAPARRRSLLASGVVADASQPGPLPPHPLVLDAGDRLYLARYHDYEQRLARRLLQAARAPVVHGEAARARLRQRLAELFAPAAADPAAPADSSGSGSGAQPAADARPPGQGLPDWQMLAAALACRSRLTVISGGPGTGKTTTVTALLACLLAEDPDCRIALAAPTGKAAARMLEALRERGARLPEALRAALPQQASTVHRLLGSRADGRFTHDAAHPLALDVLVVDEASMLDLSLAVHLLEATPAHARIVLLGDRHQLAAVEAGAVFAELGADPSLSPACRQSLAALTGLDASRIEPPPPQHPSPLQDAVVWFTRSHRFEAGSGIGRLARLVNEGAGEELLRRLEGEGEAEGEGMGSTPASGAAVRWRQPASAPPARELDELLAPYQPYLRAVQEDPTDVARAAGAFSRHRVLCATRSGRRGLEELNAALQARVRQALAGHDADPSSPWYPGRPVIVRRNDHLLQLYNGDIGLTLPDAAGQLMVCFPAGEGGFRAVAPARLPEHDTCLAMTVHQSQGSEFDSVALVLPEVPVPVLTRELVYTGITRARLRVALHAGREVLAAAVARPASRRSGLVARLNEAA